MGGKNILCIDLSSVSYIYFFPLFLGSSLFLFLFLFSFFSFCSLSSILLS